MAVNIKGSTPYLQTKNNHDNASPLNKSSTQPFALNKNILFSGDYDYYGDFKSRKKGKIRRKAKRWAWFAALGSIFLVGTGNARHVPGFRKVPGNRTIEKIDLVDLEDITEIPNFYDNFKDRFLGDSNGIQNKNGAENTPKETGEQNTPKQPEKDVGHNHLGVDDTLENVVIPKNTQPIHNEHRRADDIRFYTLGHTENTLRDVFEFEYFTAPPNGGSYSQTELTPEAHELSELVVKRVAYLIQNRPEILDTIANQGTIKIKLYEGSAYVHNGGSPAAGHYWCQGGWNAQGEFSLSTDNIPISYDKLSHGRHYSFEEFDVITHEFMHFLDGLDHDGSMACDIDGIPPGLTSEQKDAYIEAREIEKDRIREGKSHLRNYALENNKEFWATLTEVFTHNPQGLLDTNPVLFETAKIVYRFNPIEIPAQSSYDGSNISAENISLADIKTEEFMTFKYYEADGNGNFKETDSQSKKAERAKNIFISRLFGMLQNRPDLLLKMQFGDSPSPVVHIYETDGELMFSNGRSGSAGYSQDGLSITTSALEEILESPNNSYDQVVWLLTNTVDGYQPAGNGLYTQGHEKDGLLPGWSAEEEIKFIEQREHIRFMDHDGSHAHETMRTNNDQKFLTAVITSFFEQPHELKSIDGDMYQIMVDTFRLDPIKTPVFPYY